MRTFFTLALVAAISVQPSKEEPSLTEALVEEGEDEQRLTARQRLDGDQLDVEDERRVRRDHTAGAPIPVRVLRSNREKGSLAHAHRRNTEVPSLDDHASTQLEFERLAPAARGVEYRAVLQRAGVVDVHDLAGRRLVARADDVVVDFYAVRRRAPGNLGLARLDRGVGGELAGSGIWARASE